MISINEKLSPLANKLVVGAMTVPLLTTLGADLAGTKGYGEPDDSLLGKDRKPGQKWTTSEKIGAGIGGALGTGLAAISPLDKSKANRKI